MNRWNLVNLIIAVSTIVAAGATTYWLHNVEFLPQQKQNVVNFTLIQTADTIARAIAVIEERPDDPRRDVVARASEEYRAACTCYENEEYDEALEKLKHARQIIYWYFPPYELPPPIEH